MTLRTLLAAVSVALAASCSGADSSSETSGGGHTAAFVGLWRGSLGGKADGQGVALGFTSLEVLAAGSDRLTIGGLCTGGVVLPARVLGAATLSTGSVSCGVSMEGLCSGATAEFRAGDGLLANGLLSLALSGIVRGCGQEVPLEVTFTGTQAPKPAPTVVGVTPATVDVGSASFTLTVIGTGFAPSCIVTWSGLLLQTTFVSGTQLSALVPAEYLTSAGSAQVRIIRDSQRFSSEEQRQVVIRNPAPRVTALMPEKAIIGGPELTLTVTGERFLPGSLIYWNGSVLPTTFVSSTRLQATLGAMDLLSGSSGSVWVRNPAPGGGISNSATLPLENPPPTLKQLAPVSGTAGGPGMTLTVTGSGFVGSTVVRWNGVELPTYAVSSEVLHATLAADALGQTGSSEVSVFTPPPGGGTTGAAAFSIGAPAAPHSQSVAYQIDPAHSGRGTFGVPLSFPSAPTWSVTLNDLVSYPLIAEGKVFVLTRGSSTGGYFTQLHALELSTGAPAWGPKPLSGSISTSGHAFHAGAVFVSERGGKLHAFDAATGSLRWTVQLPDGSGDSAPIAADGVVYTGGANAVSAFASRDGTLLWSSLTGSGGLPSSPSLGLDGIFAADSYSIYKLDLLTGSPIWLRRGDSGGGQTPAYGGGLLYARVPERNMPTGIIYDGHSSETIGRFAGVGPLPVPAVGDEAAYVVQAGALEARRHQDQSLSWRFTGDGKLVTAPILIDDVVVVGSSEGTVFAVDAVSGAKLWSGSAGAGINGPDEHNIAQPLVGLGAGEGYLVVPAGARLAAWRLTATE